MYSLHDEHNEHVANDENEVFILTNEEIVDVRKSGGLPKDSNVPSPKSYNPPLSFPQRMAKAKLDL